MFASVPDLLRLLAVPALGWAAYRDVRTRRVPNRLWTPLAALAVVLLVWDGYAVWGDPFARNLFLIRVAVSLLVIVPLAYLFWLAGGFGGADAKAFMVLALLFPTYPTYQLFGTALPVEATRLGVFAMTILTNTVLVGLVYPLSLVVRNALDGQFAPAMVVGTVVPTAHLPETHGRLLETPDGFTRGGIDLDALRMYLRWRGATLADLRADPGLRDPATLPRTPNDPTDGAVAVDGGEVEPAADATDQSGENGADETDRAATQLADDPWGAAAFLDAVDGGAYGTTPGSLRAGLDLLVERDAVWVSPGIPFIVPLFVGLLVALAYGDLLVPLLAAVGLVI